MVGTPRTGGRCPRGAPRQPRELVPQLREADVDGVAAEGRGARAGPPAEAPLGDALLVERVEVRLDRNGGPEVVEARGRREDE